MGKNSASSNTSKIDKVSKKRKGVHAKSKSSKCKSSKLYKKKNRGQG